MLLLTTNGKAESERRSRVRDILLHVTNKLKVISDYNDLMGGVDGSDQMLHQYLDDCKSIKFWKKATFNIFARMILNYCLQKNEHRKTIK